MTDADTTQNAGDLWKLVRMVQDTIDKEGKPLVVDETGRPGPSLASLRALADQLDPEYGKY